MKIYRFKLWDLRIYSVTTLLLIFITFSFSILIYLEEDKVFKEIELDQYPIVDMSGSIDNHDDIFPKYKALKDEVNLVHKLDNTKNEFYLVLEDTVSYSNTSFPILLYYIEDSIFEKILDFDPLYPVIYNFESIFGMNGEDQLYLPIENTYISLNKTSKLYTTPSIFRGYCNCEGFRDDALNLIQPISNLDSNNINKNYLVNNQISVTIQLFSWINKNYAKISDFNEFDQVVSKLINQLSILTQPHIEDVIFNFSPLQSEIFEYETSIEIYYLENLLPLFIPILILIELYFLLYINKSIENNKDRYELLIIRGLSPRKLKLNFIFNLTGLSILGHSIFIYLLTKLIYSTALLQAILIYFIPWTLSHLFGSIALVLTGFKKSRYKHIDNRKLARSDKFVQIVLLTFIMIMSILLIPLLIANLNGMNREKPLDGVYAFPPFFWAMSNLIYLIIVFIFFRYTHKIAKLISFRNNLSCKLFSIKLIKIRAVTTIILITLSFFISLHTSNFIVNSDSTADMSNIGDYQITFRNITHYSEFLEEFNNITEFPFTLPLLTKIATFSFSKTDYISPVTLFDQQKYNRMILDNENEVPIDLDNKFLFSEETYDHVISNYQNFKISSGSITKELPIDYLIKTTNNIGIHSSDRDPVFTNFQNWLSVGLNFEFDPSDQFKMLVDFGNSTILDKNIIQNLLGEKLGLSDSQYFISTIENNEDSNSKLGFLGDMTILIGLFLSQISILFLLLDKRSIEDLNLLKSRFGSNTINTTFRRSTTIYLLGFTFLSFFLSFILSLLGNIQQNIFDYTRLQFNQELKLYALILKYFLFMISSSTVTLIISKFIKYDD